VSGSVPLTVAFSNTSAHATGYAWAFGDGVTDTVKHPIHVYSVTGVYTVSLAASGHGGTDTLTRTGYITVGAGYALSTTVITYTYDALNRLTKADYSTGESYEYEYDVVGNRKAMTTTAGATTYQYDNANAPAVCPRPFFMVEYLNRQGHLTADQSTQSVTC